MVYRKGELSPAAVDRGWPHQVALPASACEGCGYKIIHDFCKELSLCPRGHSVFRDAQWFTIYCSPPRPTRTNSWRGSPARSSIHGSAGRGAIGCGGESEKVMFTVFF
jgi:hypothetical protein